MDGHFVPNLSMGMGTVEAVRRVTKLPIDVHLMIDNPDLFIEPFAAAGATHISVHAESVVHLNRSLAARAKLRCSPGHRPRPRGAAFADRVALEYADYVLLLAVNPGFGGQGYIPNVLEKTRRCAPSLARRGLDHDHRVDGGINKERSRDFAAAGVDALVMGSGDLRGANGLHRHDCGACAAGREGGSASQGRQMIVIRNELGPRGSPSRARS